MSSPIVLVLTMGRVGSSAVYHGLAETEAFPVYHIHHIHPDELAALAPHGIDAAGRNVRDGFQARDAIAASTERVKIVTLVRDVIERNMSAAFARFRRRRDEAEMAELLSDTRAMSRFWNKFDGSLPFSWFDRELRDECGIDAYAHRFPSEGYVHLAEGRYDLLAMRSDMPNDQKSALLTDFTGVPVTVAMRNVRTRLGGPDRKIYERFQASANLTEEEIAEYARSRYMQHFFQVDVEQYVRRWTQQLEQFRLEPSS